MELLGAELPRSGSSTLPGFHSPKRKEEEPKSATGLGLSPAVPTLPPLRCIILNCELIRILLDYTWGTIVLGTDWVPWRLSLQHGMET